MRCLLLPRLYGVSPLMIRYASLNAQVSHSRLTSTEYQLMVYSGAPTQPLQVSDWWEMPVL
jgi:hypothetical protein